MNKEIRKYYKYNYRKQLDFRYRLRLLNREKNLNKRVTLAQNLIYYACANGIGVLTCVELEKVFVDLSNTISISHNIDYSENSFLHVMTQAYLVGGHTRVVERWVENSPKSQKHSIVLLDQQDVPFPKTLRNSAMNHNGELFVFEENDIIGRATKLRELASSYEYVILHVHMDDPTAIVAFGTKEFTRPIIFFNHADHSYWCGASIVDMLADLRDNEMVSPRRGIQNIYPIRIPFEPNILFLNYPRTKEESRKKLGLPLDKKIILTVGASLKYEPFASCEFCNLISEIVLKHSDVICYGIGPLPTTGNWNKYNKQFVALGSIDYGERYFDYLNACDVYINSMPISGGTAMLDAVQFHKPVLSYSFFDTKLGEIVRGIKETNDKAIFLHQLENILSFDKYAADLAKKQFDEVWAYHGVDIWKSNINIMLTKTPKNHSINLSMKTKYKIDDLAIMLSLWNQTISRKSLSIYDAYHIIKMLYYSIIERIKNK